ncbi:aarF domain containing kinase 5 isoform X2 [Haemaphysalis longicornis]
MIYPVLRVARTCFHQNALKLHSNGLSSSPVVKVLPKAGHWKKRFVYVLAGTAVSAPIFWYQTLSPPDKRFVRTSIGGLVRFAKTLKIGLTISCDYSFSALGYTEGTDEYKAMMKQCHQRSAERILKGCLENGGLYIKLGQSLVALNHLLPREYIETLEVLHDRALVRSKDEAQYIDLQQRFNGDMNGISILIRIVSWMHPNFNFAWILDYIRSCLVKELDFVHEAGNMERCARELAHLSYVSVPKVHWNKTSKRVLTMDFIHGVKISDVEGIKKLGLDLADVDRKMVSAFAEQLFHTGFVHADPHPGNVFVCKGKNRSAQIVLLDHGLYEYVSKENRRSLSQLWKSIIMNDRAGMKKYSLELGVANYPIFCEILMQRPLQRQTFRLRNQLSSEEVAYMRTMVQSHFDDVMDCIRSLPRPMLLVFRNINTVRSITKNHGHPIDRFTLMARIATKRLSSNLEHAGLLVRLQYWWSQVVFEFRLRFEYWHVRLSLLYMNLLLRLRGPNKDIEYLMTVLSGDASAL